jgi:hypothetical protein
MIKIRYRKHGLKIDSVWFCDDARAVLEESGADIVFFQGIGDPALKNSLSVPQKTMLTDLTEPLDRLFGSFTSTCRNRIRKAEREGLRFRAFQADELKADPALLASFKEDYAEFVKLKGIPYAYNDSAMAEYLAGGSLLLTDASKDGVSYARHLMLSDGKRTRGLYSVARFRTGGLDARVAANVNRFLHWKDIEYLSRLGYETYDWGGIRDEKEPDGVDQFKLEFRGRVFEYVNVFAAGTVLGKAALLLLKACRGWLYERRDSRSRLNHCMGND